MRRVGTITQALSVAGSDGSETATCEIEFHCGKLGTPSSSRVTLYSVTFHRNIYITSQQPMSAVKDDSEAS